MYCNRGLEVIRRLGSEEVEVIVVSFVAVYEPKLIVHHNKQRVKTCKELLNEVSVYQKCVEWVLNHRFLYIRKMRSISKYDPRPAM